MKVSKGQGAYGLAYASQVEQIKKQLGDLESIRKNLNMSRRQICQILLVNPSSWTRWTKSEMDAPPHFYRALQWLLYIHNKQNNNGQKSDLFKDQYTEDSFLIKDIAKKQRHETSEVPLLKRRISRLEWLIVCISLAFLFIGFWSFI